MTVLAVEDVHFSYRGTPVLQGLSLKARTGELVGIVGPNGSGKTTLLRLISGVARPSRGSISVDGTDLATLKASHRARLVAVVPQAPHLPPEFTTLELVLLGRNPHLRLLQWEGRHDLEVVLSAMEMTGILHLAKRPVGTLSGGERQRALVAMALAQEAPVLLLDEPTSSLDLAHQTSIMDLVSAIQRERGGIALVAMHDLTLAAQYCQRLVMLSAGRGYADGPPQAVLTPENISRVYGAEVLVLPHPCSGTPVVLPQPNGRGNTPRPAGHGHPPTG